MDHGCSRREITHFIGWWHVVSALSKSQMIFVDARTDDWGLEMNDSFLSTTTNASETDDGPLTDSTTLLDDDNEGSTISRETLKPGTGNHVAAFPIQWDKLRLSNGDLALSTGSIG